MGNRYSYQTFEEWCVKNNRQDILDLWDYEKNKVSPSDVPAGTKKHYYFKCPNGIHESEDRRISDITNKPDHKLICLKCTHKVVLIGEQFGELTVKEFDHEKSTPKNHRWICECSCGCVISAFGSKLKAGLKTTCGGNLRHKKPQSTISDEYDVFDPKYIRELRNSTDYYYYRQEVLKKDGYRCIICGTHKNIEVHHIYPFATYPSYRFNPQTGICLCKEHHSVSSPYSFHSVYGRYDNTPEQLEEYVNYMRKELNINEHFDVYEYMNGTYNDNWVFDDYLMPAQEEKELKDYYANTRSCIDKYNSIQDKIRTLDAETTPEEDEFLQNFCIHFAHSLIKDTGYGQIAREELCRVADIIKDVII